MVQNDFGPIGGRGMRSLKRQESYNAELPILLILS